MVKEKESPLISKAAMAEREQKYLQHLQDVGVSCGFIKEATSEFERLSSAQARQAHWEHHIRCDGLPRPYLPPEIRTFLEKKRFYQLHQSDQSVDWTLSVDESSILTQDIFRTDKTLSTLKEQMDDHIGDRFEKDVYMCLDTLIKIECMLDNNAEMQRLDLNKQMEIMEARKEVEKEIDASFDRLTYQIIRMDGVYMNSEDAMVATWGHKCDRYALDIWGLRNVPVRFREMILPLMVAELDHVGVTVQMPLSVLRDGMTLRCIHTMFDNYSQYAKSFDAVIPEGSNTDVSAGILDIESCLTNEWLMQGDIQEEMLQDMLQKRAVYEEIMLAITEKMERAAKDKKANEGKQTKAIVIPKAPKEPPMVPLGMLPDAYPIFLDREQEEYEDMLNEIYNPKNLKLMLDEINLRKCIMLGGLYSIMFVRRPSNTNFEKFNIILHEDRRILHTMEDVVADLRPPDLSTQDSRLSNRASNLSAGRSRVILQMDERNRKSTMLDDDDLPYFFVTLHLPKEFCMWGEPIPCQYLTTIQEVESDTSIVEEKKESVGKRKKSKYDSLKHHAVEPAAQIRLTNRRQSESVNVFRPTLISLLRQSKRLKPGERIVPVENFALLKQLNHLEIRQLERFCVPRVISSFKFPMEMKEELMQAYEQRPRTKNVLMRRRSVDAEDNIDYSQIDFNYDDQHAPDRIYPVFHGVEHVTYGESALTEQNYEKKSMYGLLETLDSMKVLYTTEYRHVVNQPEFTVKKFPVKKAALPPPVETRLTLAGARAKSVTKPPTRLSTSRSQLGVESSTLLQSTSSIHIDEETSLDDEDNGVIPRQSSHVHIKQEKPKMKVIHWTTKHILSSNFNRKEQTLSIKTDRLGIFGLAFNRYEHFPFRDWNMQPNEHSPEEVILTVDTFHCRVVLYITAQGIRGYVTDLSKGYVAKPVKYLDITEPISDFRILRKRFHDKSINIFAEHDASYYIENGYFSIKHVATEDHTYDAMALHCKLMKFYRSSWNRLASRRNIIMCMKNAKDQSDYTEVTIRLTPDTATFVEISELCSDDLDIIKLDFKNTWRNMAPYTDLHQTITSMNPHATDVRNKDALLIYNIKRMLRELRIMSFS